VALGVSVDVEAVAFFVVGALLGNYFTAHYRRTRRLF
jgi:hypothetical protein